MNPAQRLLRWFATEHLPADVAEVVRPFRDLATVHADATVGTEGTVAVRKLIEAKDAAVRNYIERRDQS